MRGHFRARASLVLIALALAAASCNYGLRGGGGFPGHIRTVFVAPLDNETVQYELDQQIFRALTERLPRSLGVRIGAERTADAIVRGTITRYEDVAQNYRPGSQPGSVDVIQNQVQITISLQIIDVRENLILYEATSITGSGLYQPSSQSEDVARARAIEVLIQQIIDGAQSQW